MGTLRNLAHGDGSFVLLLPLYILCNAPKILPITRFSCLIDRPPALQIFNYLFTYLTLKSLSSMGHVEFIC
jgi:hypothetical protein